jgi:predicted DNA-binding transcriptional regulator YafY
MHMKLVRLISIIMLLLERKKMSASQLAEMLEVTPRTIFRDIEAISMAGIPIVTYPGVNGGIGIMEAYKIEKKLFTVSDITALLIGLGSIHSSISSEEILTTMAKIKGLVPEKQMQDFENQITIDHTPWLGHKKPSPYLEDIRTAIHERRMLSFAYSDQSNTKSQRTIEPYRLVLKESNWYLHGYCMEREDYRLFRLSRIAHLELLEEVFTPREFALRPLDYPAKRSVTVTLLIDESLRNMMTELCGEKQVVPGPDNKWIAYFPFVENDFGYGMLLRFGAKCECLEPGHIRTELIRRIREVLGIYSNH